jgi:hypothetical protein
MSQKRRGKGFQASFTANLSGVGDAVDITMNCNVYSLAQLKSFKFLKLRRKMPEKR